MKKMLTILMLIIGFSITSVTLTAQDPPPPPPPGGGHGIGNSQPPGGGAPIGNGICLILIFGAAYSGYKITQALKKKDKDIHLISSSKINSLKTGS